MCPRDPDQRIPFSTAEQISSSLTRICSTDNSKTDYGINNPTTGLETRKKKWELGVLRCCNKGRVSAVCLTLSNDRPQECESVVNVDYSVNYSLYN